MTRPYELVVLLHPDLEIDIDTPIANVEKLIDNAGGKVTKRDNWGKKRLAYLINKQQFAVYIYFEVQLEPEKVRQLESTLLITEEVMRFLMVHQVQSKSSDRKASAREDKKDKQPTEAAVEEK